MSGRQRILGNKACRQKPTVEMTPLVDVVFILLIFFILTATFVSESGVKVERPHSQYAKAINEKFLTVAIDKSQQVYVQQKAIAASDSHSIEKALHDSHTQRIVIQADADVPTHLLLRVLDACKESGAQQVDVAALTR